MAFDPTTAYDAEASSSFDPTTAFDPSSIVDEDKIKVDNSPLTVLKDVGKLFITPAVIGFNALGYGAAAAAAGTGILEAATEGGQSDEFLGFKTSADSGYGKKFEEVIGAGLEASHKFMGEASVDALKNKGKRALLKSLGMPALLLEAYEEAPKEVQTEVEAIAYGAGSAAPDLILTALGGGKANSALKKSKGLTEADVLSTIEEPVRDTSPLEYTPKEMALEDFTPVADEGGQPLNYEGGVDFYGEPEKAGARLTPEPTNELSLSPKAFADNLELEPKEAKTLQGLVSNLELEPLPAKVLKEEPRPLEFEKVDPNSLKETQEGLDFDTRNKDINFRENATPEQGVDFIKTILTDMTNPVKGQPAQMDLPGINAKAGQTGFGKGQRGSVGFPKDVNEFIETLPKADRGVEYNGKVYRASGDETHIDAVKRIVKEVGEKNIDSSKLKTGLITPEGKFITHEQHESGKFGVYKDNTDGIPLRLAEEQFKKLGQSGFGNKQRGSVMLPARKELTPEAKAKKLNLEEFTQDFFQRHPQYRGRPEVAQQVYQRLNNPADTSFSFKRAIENSSTLKALDKGLGVVSTRVGNISQPILHRMIRYEKNLLQNTHVQIGKVDDFVTALNKLDKPTQALMNNLILNNNTEAIGKLAKSIGKPDLVNKYAAVRKVLDNIGADLKSIGRLEGLREDYFPRIVTDVEGLKATLGSTVKSALDVRLDEARKKAASNGTAFGILEESAIIDSFMRNRVAGNKPGFTKERKLDDVAPDLEKFYASPTESLHTYIRNAVSEVETARLFGKDAIKGEDGRVNIEKSIGTMTAERLRSGEINGKQAIEIEEMLKSRLGTGNRGSSGLVQDVKNISNMGLLGNVMSAITQGGDIISSAYLNGFRPTMMALVSQLSGKSKVNMKDFGLIDHISEEFVSTRSTAKALNKVFDASFFSAIDRMGKNTILNGALINGQKMVKTPKGLKEFSNRWEKRFGDEFPQLVDDLQNGRKTELTDMYTFSTLSKIQPITKIELPQKYLDMPNGRIIYMLKSFMIKQMDLFRNEAYNKIKEGKTREGLYNLSKLIMVLGIGNATTQYIKDYLFSQFNDREVEFDTNIPMNVLKTFGWSEYTADKVKEGKVGEAIGGMVLPPYKMFDILLEDSIKEMDGDEETESSGKALNFIPVVGKLLYAWSEKGQEALARKVQQKEQREDEE
jgi:hypothetical protein